MEKEKRILSYVKEVKGLVIYGNLDADNYAKSWLAFCNNKRDNKEFLELMNFYDSNKIRIVIDITDSHNRNETINHYKEFFESWGLEITSANINDFVVYVVDELELNEDKEVFVRLEI
jgi:hypothetical protein